MTSEPNLLNRITITISANNQQLAKKVLHGSVLNQANINQLLNSYFDEYNIYQDISLEKLTLDLGEISFHDFNSLFPARLKVELNKALNQYQINNHQEETLLNKPTFNKFTDNSSAFCDNYLIDAENFIHFLYQQDYQPNTLETITHNKDIHINKLIHQLTQIENKWILLLAKSCLSEHGIQRLLAIKQPALFIAINRRLSEKVNKPQHQEELASSAQLILNALEYLQRHNIQEIPKPDAKIISRIITELNNGVLNTDPIIKLFRQAMSQNTPLNSWLKQLWQTISVSQLCQKHLSVEEYQYLLECFMPSRIDKNTPGKKSATNNVNFSDVQQHQSLVNQKVMTEDQKILSTSDNTHITSNSRNQLQTINKPQSESVLLPEKTVPYQISNAGILILWPMLPALFNQLGLLEGEKFIHRQAQYHAANFLDYLIWETEETSIERNRLNNVLCGLTADENSESILLEPEKQLITSQWLDTIIAQLPGWKKLSGNDVRQLFLQRPGELLANEQEIKITIQQQPFDALLTEWPWPLNIAKLPWLDHSLLIDWQNI
ncbi:contractile injection system tape measure protein [Photorhabdus bodei]|uniref:contractile injection system tape measure protein n=1 Tax=Photorhabdus bodei TaxID=2029681 RepID=UPI0023311576|nr:contractile injection system tape measure protein [Photorhabdus bodei]MDB6367980.1 contractile injection system tape measure protein [Photorhabdus bodei]